MNYKFVVLSIFTSLVFFQCGENKQISKKENLKSMLLQNNWALSEWLSDSISIIKPTEKPITLDFDEKNNKLSGSAGCNQYFGKYSINNNNLKAGPMGSTQMYCTEEIMEQEMRFLHLLGEGVTFSVANEMLILEHDHNKLILKQIQ